MKVGFQFSTLREVAMLSKTSRLLVVFALFTLVILFATNAPQTASAQKKSEAPKMTGAQKIALAESAGPPEIAKHAAIVDMADMKELRAGTNGWVCYADPNQPMCLDKEWQKWAEAWMGKTKPKISGTGIAYMLAGDHGASNTDPYATAPTADNQWVVAPPHVMILYAD